MVLNRRTLFVFTISFLLFGCRRAPIQTPQMPELGIPFEEFNTHFMITAPDGWNSFKIGDAVSLSVEVIGLDSIAFDYKFGAVLFVLDHGEWVEIRNLMNYPEGELIVSPANGDAFKTSGTDIDPNLYQYNEQVSLRIILIGKIVRNDEASDERVAGYIDIIMTP